MTPTSVKDGVEEARGTLIEGRLLTFGRQSGVTVLTPYNQGYEGLLASNQPARGAEEFRLGIPDSRFFVLITLTSPVLGTLAAGLLIVWDAIPPDELTEWL